MSVPYQLRRAFSCSFDSCRSPGAKEIAEAKLINSDRTYWFKRGTSSSLFHVLLRAAKRSVADVNRALEWAVDITYRDQHQRD
jgi:hypothetical protein